LFLCASQETCDLARLIRVANLEEAGDAALQVALRVQVEFLLLVGLFIGALLPLEGLFTLRVEGLR
jgi:hypothetical protein